MCRKARNFVIPVNDQAGHVLKASVLHHCSMKNAAGVTKTLREVVALIDAGTHRLMGFKVRRRIRGSTISEIVVPFCPQEPRRRAAKKRGTKKRAAKRPPGWCPILDP